MLACSIFNFFCKVSAPKSQYRHVFKANVCACGEVYPRPGNSSFEEAHPYIQLGAFSTEEEMKGHFDQKHQTFVFRIPHSKVEYVKVEFVRGLKKALSQITVPPSPMNTYELLILR